jgi:hypothetical protein
VWLIAVFIEARLPSLCFVDRAPRSARQPGCSIVPGIPTFNKTTSDTPTRRHADTPIRRHADTFLPRRYAATPPRRHAATSTRRYADTPTRRYAATPPRRHAAKSPRRYAATPPRRHADTPIRSSPADTLSPSRTTPSPADRYPVERRGWPGNSRPQ